MIRMTLVPSRLTLILMTLLALGSSLTDVRGQPKACGSEIRPIEVNQTTLHYFECGEGEPIVFVHGTLGDLNVSRTQAKPSQLASGSSPTVGVIPAQRSTSGSRCLWSQHSCGRPGSAGKGTESDSSASRCDLLWRVHRARAGSGPSRTRAQPGSRRTARLPSPLSHGRGRSHEAVVAQTGHRASAESLGERESRGRSATIRGHRHRTWLFRQPPTIRTNGVGGKAGARAPIAA